MPPKEKRCTDCRDRGDGGGSRQYAKWWPKAQGTRSFVAFCEVMNRTATVRARVEPSLKEDVEQLLHRLGVTTTEAITMFYSQIRLRQGDY